FWLRPVGRYVRGASGLPCPLKAAMARLAMPGTIGGDYALESGTTSCMVPACLRQPAGNQVLLPGARSPFSRRPVKTRCHRGSSRYRIRGHQQMVSLEGSFVMGSMLAFLGRDMAVDLGTANTLVYVRRRGIALNEPSVGALNTNTGKIVAVGARAKRMILRTPGRIGRGGPVTGGSIGGCGARERARPHF